MGKNWSEDSEKRMRRKIAERMIRTVPSYSEDELKKQSEKIHAEQKAQEAGLIAAYEDKRLKSKRLIKEARALKAKKDKDSGVTE